MAGSNRETVDKFYKAIQARDWDLVGPLVTSDIVWEMPQSGERVRGADKNREMNENYPGLPDATVKRVTGSEDRWVTTPSWTVLKVTGSGDEYVAETLVKYPDGSEWHAVDFFHFQDGKIARITAYFAPTLPPAEWRSRWVERM
ncbi:MAG TPA: nuclear transport factor 2 family protein [Candidatus Dormibacteraeota bacterium]|nr:nuclear transport factor 2 family protein [Candidatus Dormibacteraeota bacterium]